MAKICYATETDPRERFERLAKWCQKNKLRGEAEFFEKSANALK